MIQNFGDLITADEKVLNEGGVNLEPITDTQSWYKIQPLNGYNLIRVKLDLHSRRKGVYESFSNRRRSPKSFILTIPWNLTKLVKTYPGIIVRQRLIVPRRMVLLRKAVRRVKEETSAVLLQSGLDNEWWADSMECFCYLRNIQDLLSDGKTLYERRCGEPVNGPVIPFGSMTEYHPISAQEQSRLHQFGKIPFGAMVEYHPISAKDISGLHQFGLVLPGIFLGYVLYAEDSGKETFWSQTLRSWKGWTHQKSMLED